MGIGRTFARALGIAGIAVDIYNTDRYLRGEIGHREYLTGMAQSAVGYFLPYPLNAALAAHSIGSALGGYLARKLLEDARNGNKVAQALLDYFRRSGFVNANDPTFIAVSESFPPDLSNSSLLIIAGAPQWVFFAVWSETETTGRIILGVYPLDTSKS